MFQKSVFKLDERLNSQRVLQKDFCLHPTSLATAHAQKLKCCISEYDTAWTEDATQVWKSRTAELGGSLAQEPVISAEFP